MRVLILHGGLGTRLRPLTHDIPKGFIPIRNISIVERIVRNCKVLDCQMVVAVPQQDTGILSFITAMDEAVQARSASRSPMETVVKFLEEDNTPVIVWWGDTIMSLDIAEMAAAHNHASAIATMALWRTDNRRELKHWGSVKLNEKGFTISHPVPDYSAEGLIKAGAFMFEPESAAVIRKLAKKSWDMSYILNSILLDKLFFGFPFDGFKVNVNYGYDLLKAANFIGIHDNSKNSIHPESNIDRNVGFGENVSIGRHVRIAEGVYLSNCMILDEVNIASGATVINSVIGPGAKIGKDEFVNRKLRTLRGEVFLTESPY